jgi:hypothetical protein
MKSRRFVVIGRVPLDCPGKLAESEESSSLRRVLSYDDFFKTLNIWTIELLRTASTIGLKPH